MQELYNKFRIVPFIPYKIINTLTISKNENFWKALFYDDYNCLSKKDLTLKEKTKLLWKCEPDEQNFRIFLKPLIANEITETTTQLRINKINIKPTNQFNAVCLYNFEIITGYKTALIELDGVPVPRIDYLEQQLLEILNGEEIGLVGTTKMKFDRREDRADQSSLGISNSKSFFGVTLVMSIGVTDVGGKEGVCNF